MTSLSYSTMNALINEPHTWINKVNKLDTYSSPQMNEGKIAHGVIQRHVSGIEIHPLLDKLPAFPEVENRDFDPKMKVSFEINKNYTFNGYTDGRNPQMKQLLEIKTGDGWSNGKFARLVQWKLYGRALPMYQQIVCVNTPRKITDWNEDNIRMYRYVITKTDCDQADEFIKKAIFTIENIDRFPLHVEGKSRWCFYLNCPYCHD